MRLTVSHMRISVRSADRSRSFQIHLEGVSPCSSYLCPLISMFHVYPRGGELVLYYGGL